MSELVRDSAGNVVGEVWEEHPDAATGGTPAFMTPIVPIPEGSVIGDPATAGETAATETAEDAATAARIAKLQSELDAANAALAAAQQPPPAPPA